MVKKLKDPLVLSFLLLIVLAVVFTLIKIIPKTNPSTKQTLFNTTNEVNKIEVTESGTTAILTNNNGLWVIASDNNLPADNEKITILLDNIKTLAIKELVSENENNQPKFGVDSVSGINLKLSKDGTTLFELIIGNAGPDYESDYIRLPDQKKVYLSNTPLRAKILTNWQDLKVASFKSGEVKEVTVSIGTMVKKYQGETTINLVNALTGLMAEDTKLIDEKEFGILGLARIEKTIEIQLTNEKITLKFGQIIKDKKQWLLKNDGRIGYLINDSVAKTIDEEAKNIFKSKAL